MSLTVSLGWPATKLWPNRRNGRHWGSTAYLKKTAREEGFFAAKAALGRSTLASDGLVYAIHAYPVGWHLWDDDGLTGALKWHLDGIAKAIGIDDSQWRASGVTRFDPVRPPRVEIIVTDAASVPLRGVVS